MDQDMLLALQLQQELDREELQRCINKTVTNGVGGHQQHSGSRGAATDGDWSVVDPRWEDADPSPDIRVLFLEFNQKFFWGKLAGIEVKWSPRMTLCAGLCMYEGHGGLCSVRLSAPLLKLRPRKDLIETLLHEMIHALLFVTQNNKDHDGHGPEFCKHMNRINQETGSNISIYHTFHEEVENYRQHWWKCDGPCQKRPPHLGLVKRAMNRAPAKLDTWWAAHQQTCGGTFHKIKEPDNYKDKKNKVKKSDKQEPAKVEAKQGQDIRKMFGGENNSSDSSSRVGKPPALSSAVTGAFPALPKVPPASSSATDATNQQGTGIWWSEANVPSSSRSTDRAGEDMNQSEVHFPGEGQSLFTSHSQVAKGFTEGTVRGPIVRRIPGFGLISNERPSAAAGSASSESQPPTSSQIDLGARSLGDLKVGVKRKSVEAVEESDANCRKKAKLKQLMEDILSDDSDDDDFGIGCSTSSNTKTNTNTNTVGGGDAIPVEIISSREGMVSVSSKSRRSPDQIYRKKTAKDVSGKKPGSFAIDRNKRALGYSSSSEDEEDNFESQPLKSVLAKTASLHKSSGKARDRRKEASSDFNAANKNFDTDKTVSGIVSKDKTSCGKTDGGGAARKNDNVIELPDERDKKLPCPVCQTLIPESQINVHLDSCLSF